MEQAINLKALFAQIAKNNPRAFQLFFDYSYTQLYRYTSYYLKDPDECKDVISEVYYRLWQNRHKLANLSNIDNYLFICVRNQALYHLRESNRYQSISLEGVTSEEMIDRRNPEGDLLHSEFRDILELAINSLPQRCRQVFFLVKEEEMKYRDVAKCLDISEKTVHAQMCIALKRISRTIREYKLGIQIKR
ncbi:RNA polymerase sigma factor [Sphingobacterium faecale]|uniref:RNA polymerase sigma-70 factor n=1 Tax=Sphingobacterium faecale TaxID=2803775 RepID=A0ABS1R9S5_9SPHI|nr:RNA polymerase sigma-70 factor [Sphingobacterium faecale]MBL1411462.1 RNA polymerase sigma-70 factor [Sphingobacterium faecale]